MTFLDSALSLASRGFRIFPIVAGEKNPPRFAGWQDWATTDPLKLWDWWTDNPNDNIGIATGEGLLVVDLDVKDGVDGRKTFVQRSPDFDFNRTLRVRTPGGGLHLFYVAEGPLPSTVRGLGDGIDTRCAGGYVVAPGSRTHAGEYRISNNVAPIPAPAWLTEALAAVSSTNVRRESALALPPSMVNQERAGEQFKAYLERQPPAPDGERNSWAYRAAGWGRDVGCGPTLVASLMFDFFQSNPPLDIEEIEKVVHNQFAYGQNATGVKAPELQFEPIITSPAVSEEETKKEVVHYGDPVEALNAEYAHVMIGGSSAILWESQDEKGQERVEFLSVTDFHSRLASQPLFLFEGAKKADKPSKLWMNDERRRQYDGIVFLPSKDAPENFYNIWKGFPLQPSPDVAAPEAHRALNMFLEHARETICGEDPELFQWLMGYFAHLFQYPGTKPLTSVVLQGNRGTGKTLFVDTIGRLLGRYYLLADNDRYLLGNFNGHLERCLLFALDEACPWAGNKTAEGRLKGIVTGEKHIIERKGLEPYEVPNLTRIVIVSNSHYVVPSGADERRFGCFRLRETHKQDLDFFTTMLRGLRAGGYSLLMDYFLKFDLSAVEINRIPKTVMLHEQKLASLEPIHQWWRESLIEERISCLGAVTEGWPAAISRTMLQDAVSRYYQGRGIKAIRPDIKQLADILRKALPSLEEGRGSSPVAGAIRPREFRFPSLEQCRAEWTKFIGHPEDWNA